MAANKFYDFSAGDKVGVVKTGGYYGHISQQGIYSVTKCNGTVIEVVRESDGYVRRFSNRTGIEKNSHSDRYNTAEVISADRYEAITVQRQEKARIEGLWSDAKQAVERKDAFALQTILNQLNGGV